MKKNKYDLGQKVYHIEFINKMEVSPSSNLLKIYKSEVVAMSALYSDGTVDYDNINYTLSESRWVLNENIFKTYIGAWLSLQKRIKETKKVDGFYGYENLFDI